MPEGASGWCERCELPRAQCEHGRGLVESHFRRITSGPMYADGPMIGATQEGRCPGCEGPIERGDWITHTEDGWAHSSEVTGSRPPANEVSFDDL